jgi:hypothetical protein
LHTVLASSIGSPQKLQALFTLLPLTRWPRRHSWVRIALLLEDESGERGEQELVVGLERF